MTYGLYDADLPFYPTPFYNLELMKLSTYYKRKREIVGLSPTFSPNMYSHFIVRQDFELPIIYPLQMDKVVYGGRVFDGEKYKPLPYDIEICKPDKNLYSSLKKKYKDKAAVSTMRRAEHIRLSLDGKTIWKDFEKQFRYDSSTYGIIFYDYNLNEIDGAFDLIKDNINSWIKSSNGRRIGMKFSIKTDNEQDLFKWLQLPSVNQYYALEHTKLIDKEWIPIFKEIKQVNSWRQIKLNINEIIKKDDFTSSGINKLYRYIINLRTNLISFPLIYDENILTDEWKKVMKLISFYNQHMYSRIIRSDYVDRNKNETMYSYIRGTFRSTARKDDFFEIDSIREIFQFVRFNNYNLFKDFYEYRGEEVI